MLKNTFNKENMVKKIILTITLFFIIPSFACLNESRILINGQTTISDEESLVPHGHLSYQNRKAYEKELIKLYNSWNKDKQIEDYSDYGVVLVYLGEYDKALKVFQEIEKIKPGLYATAANMGTTYELLGNNLMAYKWIKKGIEIDPNSHDGSEWLHLKILEIKIKGKYLLNSKFLIGLDFGNSLIPKSELSEEKLNDLKYQIYFQLNERVSFIKPKDEIIALLLFELGNICSITDDATSAYRIYKRAEEYGYSSPIFLERFKNVSDLQNSLIKLISVQKKEADKRKIELLKKQKIDKVESKRKNKMYLIISGIAILAIALFFVLKAKRKHNI